MKKNIMVSLITICLAAAFGYGQRGPRTEQQSTAREDALDPTPIDPAVDANNDMFVNNWKNSQPRTIYGHLVIRDILTRLEGPDPVHPAKRGAVLLSLTAISYATLAPGAIASGRAQKGEQQVFYATGGAGEITVNSKPYNVKDGTGFTLTPDFDFKLSSNGKEPLTFYVRIEPLADNYTPNQNLVVVNRFDNDRRVGAHWVHIGNGGPAGLSLITIAPHTIPQPHSHANEEMWIMVKGETICSLGKHIYRMTPGTAYKIPPTGVVAHTNINMGEEPVQMLFVGANRGGGPGGRAAQAGQAVQAGQAAQAGPGRQGGQTPQADYGRLDNSPINRATEHDVDMFMNNWRDAFPRIVHGNLYFRDMLTALVGPDSLHPARKGACLENAEAVSYAMLEPNSTAHKIDGELKGIQEIFVVNSGTGVITSGSQKVELAQGMAFIITPDLDFRLTATGDKYLTFYVVSEKLPQGFTPKTTLQVIDNRSKATTTKNWVDVERPLITKDDGLSQYSAIIQVEMDPMTMARPYSAGQGIEEIWITTDSDTNMLFGKQLRSLPIGTAYRIPSTGITAHSNINTSNKKIHFLYMVK
jgi:mannose-6-phosphate isomerase-like protein (cupin superfamily)